MTGPGSVDETCLLARPLHLGASVLMETQQSSVEYRHRHRSTAGRSVDYFRVSMLLGDDAGGGLDSRFAAPPGDISIVDMASDDHTSVAPLSASSTACVLSLTVPRAIVVPLLTHPCFAYVTVIPRDSCFGRLMREHLLALRRYGSQLSETEGEAAIRATARLLAGGLGRPPAERGKSSREKLFTAIKTHIEQNLGAPTLNTGRLCRRFGVSRGTLYRLLQPEGGVDRYLRQRRLCRAFRQLASPEFRHWRILDFAVDSQFSSHATFTRAFRRLFDITPGQVRARADAARAGAGPPLDPPELWLDRARELTRRRQGGAETGRHRSTP